MTGGMNGALNPMAHALPGRRATVLHGAVPGPGPLESGRLLAIEQRLETGERRMGCAAHRAARTMIPGRFQLALVLVVMAVKTQQLPVAAIGRVVVVVMVAVMDRQLAQVGMGEL